MIKASRNALSKKSEDWSKMRVMLKDQLEYSGTGIYIRLKLIWIRPD